MPFQHGKFGASKSEKPAAKPEHEKSAAPQQDHKPSGMHEEKHARETHGTSPHPSTGVHAHMITHHGGAAKSHTHHDDGSIEHQDHASLQEAHSHGQQMLPPSEMAGETEPMEPGQGAAAANLKGLGGFQG